jgi:hypothetical protein
LTVHLIARRAQDGAASYYFHYQLSRAWLFFKLEFIIELAPQRDGHLTCIGTSTTRGQEYAASAHGLRPTLQRLVEHTNETSARHVTRRHRQRHGSVRDDELR